jgi:hypothetical protein
MKYCTKKLFSLSSLVTLLLLLSACGQKFATYPEQVVDQNAITLVPSTPATSDLSSGAASAPPAPSQAASTGLKFCSPLSFSGITWNQELTLTSRRSFAIALSQSGSFEGGAGWENITNNFDGMGLSAGLLNQTLGTGSLQPLFAEMETAHRSEFSNIFTSAHLRSILAMIDSWKSGSAWQPQTLALAMSEAGNRDAVAPTISIGGELSVSALSSPRIDSVSWAINNLYNSSGGFLPTWKQELQTLLREPDYVTLQVGAALHYHLQAIRYMNRIGMSDLRSYLLMFDIVTQNGSISETRFQQWDNQVAAQHLTNETAKLKALVELRLLDSNPRWRADVRSRKYAIIDGTGVVHGSQLNLPKSFCYKGNDPVQ